MVAEEDLAELLQQRFALLQRVALSHKEAGGETAREDLRRSLRTIEYYLAQGGVEFATSAP